MVCWGILKFNISMDVWESAERLRILVLGVSGKIVLVREGRLFEYAEIFTFPLLNGIMGILIFQTA